MRCPRHCAEVPRQYLVSLSFGVDRIHSVKFRVIVCKITTALERLKKSKISTKIILFEGKGGGIAIKITKHSLHNESICSKKYAVTTIKLLKIHCKMRIISRKIPSITLLKKSQFLNLALKLHPISCRMRLSEMFLNHYKIFLIWKILFPV